MERDITNNERGSARASKPASVRHWNPLLIVGIVVFAALSFYASLVVATQLDHRVALTNAVPQVAFVKELPGVDEDCTGEQASEDERINVLVMGLDLRRDEDPDIAARTDTVFIMTLDECDKTAGILSIPRDLAVDIPVTLGGEDGYFSDRVNTAYVYGEGEKKGDGPKYAVEAVEYSFDIKIDHYAVLNFNNFIEIVDELGGVDVNVPEYVWDPAYSDCNECGAYYVEFDEGTQHMDGETALTYARLRHSDNDFKRIERQQLVMRAIGKKAATLNVFDLDKARGMYDKYKDAVKTDIPDSRLPGFAKLGQAVGVDNIVMESLSEAVYPCPYSQCNGAAILLPIPEKVAEVKARVFSNSALQKEAALIRVLNGTPTPKLGEDFASYLRSQGVASDRITVDEYANGELFENTFVVIHDDKDYPYTTSHLAEWLGWDESRVRRMKDLPIELQAKLQADIVGITVVLATDSVVPEPPSTVGDYEPEYDTYYEPEVEDEYVPEDTPVPEPVFEPTPEPVPEPTAEPVPEPTPEPPPVETPPPAPSGGDGNPGNGNGNGNGHGNSG